MMRKTSAVYSAPPPRGGVNHSSGGMSKNGPKTSYVVSGMSRGSAPGFSESISGNHFGGSSAASRREISTERLRRCSGAAVEYRQAVETNAVPVRCPLSTDTEPGVSPMYQNVNRPPQMMRNGSREHSVQDAFYQPINSTAAACENAPPRIVSSSFTPRPTDANRENCGQPPASFVRHKASVPAVPALGFGPNKIQEQSERNGTQSASNAFGRAYTAAPLKERNANSVNVYLPSNRNPEMRPQNVSRSSQPPQLGQETDNNQNVGNYSLSITPRELKDPSWMKCDGSCCGDGAFSTASTPQSTMPQCTAGFTVQNSVVINNRSGVASEPRERTMDANVPYSPNATFTKDMNVQVGTDVNFTTSTPLPDNFSNRRSNDLSSNNNGSRYWTPSEGFRETGPNGNNCRKDYPSPRSAQSVVLESPETNDVDVLAGRVLRAAARTGESMGSVERPVNGSFEFGYDCVQKPAGTTAVSPVLPAEFRGYTGIDNGSNRSFQVPQGNQQHVPCVSPITPQIWGGFRTPMQEVPDQKDSECGRCSCNEEARRRWMWMAHQALEMAAATSGKCAECRDRKSRGFLDTFG